MATRRRKRQSKGVTNVGEEENNVSTEGQTETVCTSKEIIGTDEDAPKNISEKEQEEEQDEPDSQMDTVIEVKGSAPTVTVTYDQKTEEEELDNTEKRTNTVGQIMEIGSSTEDASPESTEEISLQEPQAKGKRKAPSAVETSPSKKTKLINDGFCVFISNLNNSKEFEEVKDSLANYFMTQSLLFQDIRLNKSKKHAHVDLASEMDLTKALSLNGEMVLDKPIKIAKAKVKSEDKVKVKATPEEKKAAKDAKCLFLKNVPYNATKEDIMKIFRKAVTVRFPGKAEGPKKGIAFVEFKNKRIAQKVRQKKRVAQIQDRVLIVDSVGARNVPKDPEANDDDDNNNNNTKAAAPPNNTLFVNSLSFNAKEKHLKKVFKKAVSINLPQSEGKSKGYAFVEFANVAEAEKALQSSKNVKIFKRAIKVEFGKIREKSPVQSKSLMVVGLAEKTTAETLKSAFEGSLSARVIADKETGVSKRFGFVEFASEENSKAIKEAMEDCEIDGSKVTVIYAKPRTEKNPAGGRRGSAGGPYVQPAGRGAAKGGRGSRGGNTRFTGSSVSV